MQRPTPAQAAAHAFVTSCDANRARAELVQYITMAKNKGASFKQTKPPDSGKSVAPGHRPVTTRTDEDPRKHDEELQMKKLLKLEMKAIRRLTKQQEREKERVQAAQKEEYMKLRKPMDARINEVARAAATEEERCDQKMKKQLEAMFQGKRQKI